MTKLQLQNFMKAGVYIINNFQNTNINDMFLNYPDLLTIDDLQKALGIGRTMAYRLINNGQIRHIRIGKNIKVPKRFIVDFIFGSCYNVGSSKSAVNEKEV